MLCAAWVVDLGTLLLGLVPEKFRLPKLRCPCFDWGDGEFAACFAACDPEEDMRCDVWDEDPRKLLFGPPFGRNPLPQSINCLPQLNNFLLGDLAGLEAR